MANETAKNTDPKVSRTADAGEAEIQQIIDKESAQGYRGVVADPTENRAYTLQGVVAGEPTPETDEGQAKAAAERLADLSRRSDPGAKGR